MCNLVLFLVSRVFLFCFCPTQPTPKHVQTRVLSGGPVSSTKFLSVGLRKHAFILCVSICKPRLFLLGADCLRRPSCAQSRTHSSCAVPTLTWGLEWLQPEARHPKHGQVWEDTKEKIAEALLASQAEGRPGGLLVSGGESTRLVPGLQNLTEAPEEMFWKKRELGPWPSGTPLDPATKQIKDPLETSLCSDVPNSRLELELDPLIKTKPSTTNPTLNQQQTRQTKSPKSTSSHQPKPSLPHSNLQACHFIKLSAIHPLSPWKPTITPNRSPQSKSEPGRSLNSYPTPKQPSSHSKESIHQP